MFNRTLRIQGGSPQKGSGGSLIASSEEKDRALRGVDGKEGCFLPPLAKRPELTFNYFISFQTILKREGTRRDLKTFASSKPKHSPDLVHHPLTSFDKTENITALHTKQKTFRKPLLLFPIPTRVSVTHNRNLRTCYRFQLKTSLCDVHFKMAYKSVVGWWGGMFNRRVRFQGGSPKKGAVDL
ncbi:hypothetical protein CEXT_806441 [Caerostris extrusa]|uniref:Uncharacterized protein n=1 Tax=Caerostris extrusa TaxID=172846 RepID=A0AAV4UCC5_CAEEX|nr:hypothetical protein CEXT_806441 [Caerostris extrusa]